MSDFISRGGEEIRVDCIDQEEEAVFKKNQIGNINEKHTVGGSKWYISVLDAVPAYKRDWEKIDKDILREMLSNLNDKLIFEVKPTFILGNIMFIKKLFNVEGKENQCSDIRYMMEAKHIGRIDERISNKFLSMVRKSGIEFYK